MTDLREQPAAWPISEKFRKILEDIVREQAGSCVVIFKDPNYTADTGGYHPVEIMVGAGGDIAYISDFSYSGMPPYSELSKEIDFDFSNRCFNHLGFEYDISAGRGLFQTWQSNFCNFYSWNVYEVTVHPI